MLNYKLTIAYEGTHYNGWQVQANGISIQEVIEKALFTILQERVKIIASGRTDSGVHALGQVANFCVSNTLDLVRFSYSLNSVLPKDIRIVSIEEVSYKFHARYDATSKVYRYHIHQTKVLNPFKRHTSWHYPQTLHPEILKEAIFKFIGTHDFRAFANEASSGVASYDSVRTINRIDVVEEDGGFYLEFEGDGFLYKMVRNIVGMLIDCAAGKRSPAEIPALLLSKDRRLTSAAAPPQGLFLVSVTYP